MSFFKNDRRQHFVMYKTDSGGWGPCTDWWGRATYIESKHIDTTGFSLSAF